MLLVAASVDDFACAYSHEHLFADFKKHMDRYVPTTVQTGHVLKYLNQRVVQSDQGISYDQTHHIKTNVIDLFFPPSSSERVKGVDTPYRTDSQYEKDLNETLPATKEELQELEKQYGASYHTQVGMLMHIFQVSQFTTGFAITRLAQFASCPNKPAFEGIRRIARHLVTHPHTPIFYPRQKLKGYQTIQLEVQPGQVIRQLISNLPVGFADSDHARDKKTRKSITCVIFTINCVIVHWIMGKQSCVAAHSTESEIRAYYTAVQFLKYFRLLLTWLGHDMSEPTTIFEDNQPAIDIMQGGQITSRVKHMAVPIAITQEAIEQAILKISKIDGRLNPPDCGTKPLPSSSLHRHARWLRGQRFYPSPMSEHGILMEVARVNQRINDIENNRPQDLINLKDLEDVGAIYDKK